MVPATRHPPAIRGRRPLRQHRRHRAIHPDAEGRRAPTHSHPARPPEDASRTQRDRRLAQLLPASQLARRPNARRTISAYPCRLPKTAIRAQAAMAQQFALRLAEGQGPGRARSPPATRGGLPPGTQAPAHHHAEARGVTVSGIPASPRDLGTRPPCSRPISTASWTSPPAWSILLSCQTIVIAALFGGENYPTFTERDSLDHHRAAHSPPRTSPTSPREAPLTSRCLAWRQRVPIITLKRVA